MAESKERNAADAYNNVSTFANNTKSSTDNINPGKAYSVDYGSAVNEITDKNVKEKEARMFQILGSRNLSQSQTIKRIQALADSDNANDIALYHELMRLATDIDNYYNNQHNGFVNFFQRIGGALTRTTKNGEQVADRVVQTQRTLPGGFIYGAGTDNIQRKLLQNYKDFKSNILPNVRNLTPEAMIETLHKIQEYYKEEYNMLMYISNTPANTSAITASKIRLSEYANIWNECGNVMNNVFANDAMKFTNLIEAYLNNPPTTIPKDVDVRGILDNIATVKMLIQSNESAKGINKQLDGYGGVE